MSAEEQLIKLLYDLSIEAEHAGSDSHREWVCCTMRKVIELYNQLKRESKLE